MTIQTPPPAPPSVPPDEPSRSDQPAIFVSKADAFLAWFKDLRAALASFVGWWPTFKGELDATIAQMNTGAGIALVYQFDAATGDADPGPGVLRLSNAVQNASAAVRMDILDANGVSAAAVIDLFDDSNSIDKGLLKLQAIQDPTRYLIVGVTAVAALAGYRNVVGAVLASSAASPFIAGDDLLVSFVPSGDIATGTVSSTDVQLQRYIGVGTAGTAAAYTVAPDPPLLANTDGASLSVIFNAANAAAATIAISGLPALTLKKYSEAGAFASLDAGDIQVGSQFRVTLRGAVALLEGTPGSQRVPSHVGNAGKFLSSDGLKALWALVAGRLLAVRVLANGAYVPSVGTTQILVLVVAAGGGGAGTAPTGSGQVAGGGGGGGGGWALSWLTSGFANAVVSNGAAGAGAVGTTGATGGSTSFGALLSATGGQGAPVGNAAAGFAFSLGGIGGIGSGGNIMNGQGGAGGVGLYAAGIALSGKGGSSVFGDGAYYVASPANGATSQVIGGGGAGAAANANFGALQGGFGAIGRTIVWEFT